MATNTISSIFLKGGTVLYHDENDNVNALRNTDVLVKANRIEKIGERLSAPPGADVVDCRGKIISPGFIDTHHHLWQTQLKGQHADQTVFDYLYSGFWQSHIYNPRDMFWGQLGGAMEAIDVGTTFVLDHAHGCRSREHANEALSATIASGIRSIFAYAHAPVFKTWDSKVCELSRDLMPESSMNHIFELSKKQPFGNGRVTLGFGFDYYFLPKDAVVGIFQSLRSAGIKLFTSHSARNAVFGPNFTLNALVAYDLVKTPSDILLSHATGTTDEEKALLAKTKVPVSSTPDTEAQMGFGWPISFTPGVNFTFGVDCHSNNTSSIIHLARSALQMARQQTNLQLLDKGKLSLRPKGSTEEAFNAATIRAARAVLLGDEIGSIEEGKLADLVIFDTLQSPGMSCVSQSDPLTAVVRHSDVRDIEGVIVDGVWRKKGGKLCSVTVEESGDVFEWTQVREELLKSQEQILIRQKSLNMEKAAEALTASFGINKANLVE